MGGFRQEHRQCYGNSLCYLSTMIRSCYLNLLKKIPVSSRHCIYVIDHFTNIKLRWNRRLIDQNLHCVVSSVIALLGEMAVDNARKVLVYFEKWVIDNFCFKNKSTSYQLKCSMRNTCIVVCRRQARMRRKQVGIVGNTPSPEGKIANAFKCILEYWKVRLRVRYI